MDRIKKNGIKKMIFQDDLKGERWIFKPAKVFSHMTIKAVGQEKQCYFPIDICTKEKFAPKPEMIFDSERQVYIELPPKVGKDPISGVPTVEVTTKLSSKQVSLFNTEAIV